MSAKRYSSNISAAWSFERQMEVLASAPPGVDYRDELSPRHRRTVSGKMLAKRTEMLRTTTRPGKSEDIWCASVAVFALSMEDMILALSQASARGATVHFLAEDIIVRPASGAVELHQVAERFAEVRREQKASTAGEISARQRMEAAERRADAVRARWPLPSEDYPTAALLAEAKLSYNTAKRIMGARPEAQAKHQAELLKAQQRDTRRAKRKAREGGE